MSLRDGAILPWAQSGKGVAQYFERLLEGLAQDLDFSLDEPWGDLSEEVQNAILNGNNFEVTVRWRNRFGREMKYTTGFEGVIPFIQRKNLEADTEWTKQRFASYLRETPVPGVRGKAAQARGARGHHQRLLDLRRQRAQPARGLRLPWRN